MSFFEHLKSRLFTLKNVEKKSKSKVINNKNNPKQEKLNKYIVGLEKSRFFFSRKIKEIQSRHNKINENFFNDLEELLITSDISVELVEKILSATKKETKLVNIQDPKLINEILANKMFISYTNRKIIDTKLNIKDNRINVILVTGVNGSGKTTSIAKIAYLLKQKKKKVLIVAADTFRAGAVEQLAVWAKRVGVDIIKPEKAYIDPSAVVYDGIKSAEANKYDVLIIDTAGRLQNKVNLMQQLQKINKVISKKLPTAPYESLLILDSTTGQNAISQAKNFKTFIPITGIVLTKMDGTAKGGIVLTIKDQLDITVKLIGFGEKLEDLQEFNLDAFIYGLTKDLMI